MLRRIALGGASLIVLAVCCAITWQLAYARGKASGYLAGVEHLMVLREFAPAMAEKASDKNALADNFRNATLMQSFYMLDEYFELPYFAQGGSGPVPLVNEAIADYKALHDSEK